MKIFSSILIHIICWGAYVYSVLLPYGNEIILNLENSLNNITDWDLKFIIVKIGIMLLYAIAVQLINMLLHFLLIIKN